MTDFLVLILIGFSFGLLVEYPLLYARMRNKTRWLPINAPPWMLGDDYHYYSTLNDFHKIFLRFLGKNVRIQPMSRMAIFQRTGYIFNLLPYHLGYMIEDKRLGVLFVKIWNRFFLFLGTCLISTEIYRLLGKTPSTLQLTLIFVAYFFMYPGPWTTNKNTMLWNFRDTKFMFHWVHVNDFTRGMHSETTAPLLLLLTGATLRYLALDQSMYPWIALASSLLLFFQYFPAFAIYIFFGLVISLFHGAYLCAGTLAGLSVVLSIFYTQTLKKCPVSNELIVHDDGGKIFRFSKRYLAELILMIVAAAGIFAYFGLFVGVIFSSFAIFVGTLFLYKHQFSRFWDRGALIFAQLIVIILLTAFVEEMVPVIAPAFYVAGLIILTGIGAVFFTGNARYLYARFSTVVPEKIPDKVFEKTLEVTGRDNNFVTNSLELAYYIGLYSNNNCVLKNYSIQTEGYKEHLRNVCCNFKAAAYRLPEVIKLLTTTPGEWRSVEAREKADDDYPYFHEAQYMATNYRFNRKIIDDGMYVNGIWTKKYKELLTRIWKSIKLSEAKNIVLLRV